MSDSYTLVAVCEDGRKELFGGGNPETEVKKCAFPSIDAAVRHIHNSRNTTFAKVQKYSSVLIAPIRGDTYGAPERIYTLEWVKK